MTELYPLIDGGRLVGVIGSGGDATLICSPSGQCRYFLWLNVERAIDITELLDSRGVLRIKGDKGEGFAPIGPWVMAPPYVHARVVADLDEYARWLARLVGKEIRGRRVLLGFSGGKDSLAALLVLLKLQEYISFKLHIMYIHIPFLESPRSVRFVETVEEKLGVTIEFVEAPRREMKALLKWKGMPRRGYRFCTMYKAKPMRKVLKEDPRAVEVVGDRLTESPKRFERLYKAAAARLVLAGRKFRPTYMLTLLDTISLVRRSGLIHPAYLEGSPRVACDLCPYRVLYEFAELPELEDPGLIEKVFEKTWKKWYNWTSYEYFKEQHLWRFPAKVAKPIAYAKQLIGKRSENERYEILSRKYVVESLRKLWLEESLDAPVVEEPWLVAEAAIRAWKRKMPLAMLEDNAKRIGNN
jgi:3'-phosphoadenosine 5'-phosphosulfate sulfotransferase (PAPS reductase)/FAD synthetase